MIVIVKQLPAFKAAVLPAIAEFNVMGREVRKAWHQVDKAMPAHHPNRANAHSGIVFIPQWEARVEGKPVLYAGVEINTLEDVPNYLEVIEIPVRTYATIRVQGDREHMWSTYRQLDEWIANSAEYRLADDQGSLGFEVNDLQVNPFDIPWDTINEFNYEIHKAIVKK
ncbi:GyrI-like domain-containing protein [Paenibacillus sedimenti]|uniref:GyrI-like domain-containing protein n=1 Tax=Paenibacillus sedimenti TaxID=2770274 RepID=A0A926QK68_9BACL|nr:GyrI-like domain-containing protein [Paenibacillus sedimenti]MBD0382285.1 GyrI-like domain-containing protein [Paenibacillus sedimenti]